MRHYDVADSTGAHYYVDQSLFTSGKPDLTFHEGTTDKGPIVSVVHMPKMSFDCKVGLGDPAQPDSVRWEDLTRETVRASEHRWSMQLPDGSRKNLVWKRTHNVGADGESVSSFTNRNYKLLDAETEELLAVFTSDRGVTTCGTLQINVQYGRDFDIMVLTTCLSLYEKARKRAARSAGGGGGGP